MNRINVTRSSMPTLEEYTKEIEGLFESHWLTNAGAKHEELKEKLRDYLGVNALALTVNGHMALELALQLLDLPEGGEVITTPFTFVSTTHAIVRSGLKPVFTDIRRDDCTMDPELIEEKITPNTVAVMPVHVYGNLCDVKHIEEIASKHGLKVIYDAAHTFGERLNVDGEWKGSGSFGDLSCFSFHATKVYNTIEGGAVCCNTEEEAERIAVLRDFGILDEETITDIAPNAKMNEFSAAMGLCNLRHVDKEIARRKKVNDLYRERLSGVKGIRLCPERSDVKSNYAYFPIFIDRDSYGMSRDELFERLKENSIGARKYFYPMITELDCYKNLYDSGETPVAHEAAEEVMTIPMYADLPEEDVERITGILLNN
ncbi:MAG: DegT/DnrJ/EryC1/StrS family aminotransferase [Lachnospiraceae bacterium]|nr:DegT/DnrJ/EryC1/StrS family aminotransferase [Lachnospiraceae bacterium]